MKTVVLSHQINSKTPLYGGKGKVRISPKKSIKRGDTSNSLNLNFSNHTGTHVDVPHHFIQSGKTLTDFSPQKWLFKNVLVLEKEVSPGQVIDGNILGEVKREGNVQLLILKTGFEKYRSTEAYIKQSPVFPVKTIRFLKKKFPKLQAIGFDFISLSSLLNREEGRRAHKELLKDDILIVEDMRLSSLKDKPDFILVSPLWIEGADGSPVSVWAFYEDFDWKAVDNLLFDFDGVILESVDVKAQAFYKMYQPYGIAIAKKVMTHHRKYGGMSRFDKFRYYHKNFLGIELSQKEINTLATKFASLTFSGVVRSAFVGGVKQFLGKCFKEKKRCFIASGAPEKELKQIISRLGLGKYFLEIKGSPKPKARILGELIRRHSIDRSKAVFFGDSIVFFLS